jgi:transcriptional regulator with XRE-family HTH domain
VKVRELGRFIRDQRGAARLSLRRLSKLAGISNPYLSQIERGLRRPSAEILQAIAKALRISAETLYVKAGILEERTDTANLSTVIRRDDSLTAQQKQLLLDVYQSFQRGSKPRRAPVRKVAAAKRSRAAASSTKAKAKAKGATKTTKTTTGKATTRPRVAGKGKAAPKRATRTRRTTRRSA